MEYLYRRLLTGLLACAIGLMPVAAIAAPFTGLVIFGDSLSDTGNNAIVFDNVVAPSLPAGTLRTPVPIASPAFIPDFPYASGRYSNGPVWIEQVAASLGLQAAPSLAGGSNFAYGGARAGQLSSPTPYSLSLRDQLALFMTGSDGAAPSGDLFVVQAGGNDARDALALIASGGNPAPLISAYVSGMVAVLSDLAAAGGEHFLLVNVPDIGKLPAVQALGAATAAAASGLSLAFNAALDATLAQLPAALTDELLLLDLFALQNQVFSDPAFFNINDVTSACAFSAACIANPAGTFYWDGIHPTSAGGHALIAGAALAQVPLPGSVYLFALGMLALAFMRRRTA
ncbi:MAG: SGNH/GDSL hydrolase family protein [Noviherbaspirillum sp.]